MSAWRLPDGGPLFFGSREPHYLAKRIQVPCQQCLGCRDDRAKQWAMRIMHEASLHPANSFVTLTYDPAFLPERGTLVKKHFQDYMKRLRFRIEPARVRFYHCGEYGDEHGRPHYHAILFNYTYPDMQYKRRTSRGDRVYTSELLAGDWGMGLCEIGEVTYESAKYVAGYVIDRVTGDLAEDYYQRVDPETGEIYSLLPEYATMSRRPGIGKGWFEKFPKDVFPKDYVIVDGRKHKVPRFYDEALKSVDERAFLELKEAREVRGLRHSVNNSPDRLKVREEILRRKLQRRSRSVG